MKIIITQRIIIMHSSHGEKFVVKITIEFCNRKIDPCSAAIEYTFVSYLYFRNLQKFAIIKFLVNFTMVFNKIDSTILAILETL